MIHQFRQNGRGGVVLAGLLLAALGLASATQPETKKKPIPSADAQRKAEAVIRGIFKAKYVKRRTTRRTPGSGPDTV